MNEVLNHTPRGLYQTLYKLGFGSIEKTYNRIDGSYTISCNSTPKYQTEQSPIQLLAREKIIANKIEEKFVFKVW